MEASSIWHWIILLILSLLAGGIAAWTRKAKRNVGRARRFVAPEPPPAQLARSNLHWIFDQSGKFAFVSYSSQDQARAMAVVAEVEARGLKCWIAPRDVPPGSEYHSSIVTAIEYCGVVLLLFSRSAQDSEHVKREVSVAQQLNKKIVPARIDEFEAVGAFRYMLSNLHWIDLRHGQRVPFPLL